MVNRCDRESHAVGELHQGWRRVRGLRLFLQKKRAETDAVGVGFHAWKHEAGLVYWVFHEAVDCVLEFFGRIFGGEVLVPRARCEHEGAIWTPGQAPNKRLVLSVVQEHSVRFFLRFSIILNNLRILLVFDLSFLSRFNGKFMEKLLLIFEFTIFINSHCGIRACSGNQFHCGMHRYALHKFLMSLESLNLSILVWWYLPQDCRTIQRPTEQKVWIIAPAKVHHITNVAPELSGLSPLDFLLEFAKLHRNGF